MNKRDRCIELIGIIEGWAEEHGREFPPYDVAELADRIHAVLVSQDRRSSNQWEEALKGLRHVIAQEAKDAENSVSWDLRNQPYAYKTQGRVDAYRRVMKAFDEKIKVIEAIR
ncbi:MAG: hypothetical protein ACLGPL_11585 [Acidobacteriota bacterium]